MDELVLIEKKSDTLEASHQSGHAFEFIWKNILKMFFSNFTEEIEKNVFNKEVKKVAKKEVKGKTMVVEEKHMEAQAEVDSLFIVKEEIPQSKFDELLTKGGTLVYPNSTQPIRPGILTLETSNTFLHENEIDKKDKIIKAIEKQIIADIRKIDKIETLQSFQNLMFQSSKKFISNRKITTIFVFNGVDPSSCKSEIELEIRNALKNRVKGLNNMDVYVIWFPYPKSAKLMSDLKNEESDLKLKKEVELIKEMKSFLKRKGMDLEFEEELANKKKIKK